MTSGFECSLLELDLIGDALGVNLRVYPFQFPVHGEQADDRRRLISVAHQSLSTKGLIDGSAFVPEVEELITLTARGQLAIVMLGETRRRSYRVRAVIEGARGIIATQRGELIRFTPVRPAIIVRTLVGMLPPMRPGPGNSVTLTQATTSARPRRQDEDFSARSYLETASPASGTAGSQWAVAEQILQRPRIGDGYFTVSTPSTVGQPVTMSWVDTDAGRYAALPTTSADGRMDVTYTPADLPRLEQNLVRLVNGLL